MKHINEAYGKPVIFFLFVFFFSFALSLNDSVKSPLILKIIEIKNETIKWQSIERVILDYRFLAGIVHAQDQQEIRT